MTVAYLALGLGISPATSQATVTLYHPCTYLQSLGFDGGPDAGIIAECVYVSGRPLRRRCTAATML